MKFTIVLFLTLFLQNLSIAQEENGLPWSPPPKVYDIGPVFPGGSDAMMKYFSDSVRYPEPEQSKGLEGGVMLAFFISHTGQVIKVRGINGTPGAPNFVKEAIRLVECMPTWTPATLDGKPVESEYFLSVPFKLKRTKH